MKEFLEKHTFQSMDGKFPCGLSTKPIMNFSDYQSDSDDYSSFYETGGKDIRIGNREFTTCLYPRVHFNFPSSTFKKKVVKKTFIEKNAKINFSLSFDCIKFLLLDDKGTRTMGFIDDKGRIEIPGCQSYEMAKFCTSMIIKYLGHFLKEIAKMKHLQINSEKTLSTVHTSEATLYISQRIFELEELANIIAKKYRVKVKVSHNEDEKCGGCTWCGREFLEFYIYGCKVIIDYFHASIKPQKPNFPTNEENFYKIIDILLSNIYYLSEKKIFTELLEKCKRYHLMVRLEDTKADGFCVIDPHDEIVYIWWDDKEKNLGKYILPQKYTFQQIENFEKISILKHWFYLRSDGENIFIPENIHRTVKYVRPIIKEMRERKIFTHII